MEGLICTILGLIVLAVGALPVLSVVLGMVGRHDTNQLKRVVADQQLSLRALERRIQTLEKTETVASGEAAHQSVSTETVTESPQFASIEPEIVRPRTPRPPPLTTPASAPISPPVRAPISPERVVVWVARGLGGFLVLLASLFALAVAIDRGWLSPALRVGLGLGAGTCAWLLGAWLRSRRFRWISSALSGAGMGVLYGSLFAAHGLYGLIDQLPTGLLMAAVTAVALLDAVKTDDRLMAWLSLVGGMLTPLLVSSGSNHPVRLFGYLALLLCGTLASAGLRRWPELVVGAAAGSALLFGTWTFSYHTPDQLPVALLAAAVLTLPFSALALRSRSSLVAGAAWLGSLAMVVSALPWLGPIDPVFVDTWSQRTVHRDLGSAPVWVAGGVMVLPLLPHLVARLRGWLLAQLATGLATVAMAGLAVGTWSLHHTPPVGALAVLILAPSLLGFVAHFRDRSAGLAWALGPLCAGPMLVLARTMGATDPALFVGVIAALVALGAVHAWSSGAGLVLLALIPATALPLGVAAVEMHVGGADALGTQPLAAATLFTYAVLATVPLLRTWSRHGAGVRITAALAALVYFGPLYQVWVSGLGDPLIGLLPLLLGAGALIGGLSLVRLHRADQGDGVLAIFVGVALAGLSAALPLQLEGQWLTVAWALEAVALAWLSGRLRHPLVPWASLALGATVTARLVLNPWALAYGDAGGWPILNWTLYTWGLPLVCLLMAARLLRSRGSEAARTVAPPALTLMAIAVGFALVNVEVSHLFQDQGPIELGGRGVLQGMVRSLSWGAYGVVVLLSGFATRSRSVRLVGFAFVLLATAKVFVVDLWALSGFVRVGSVLGLGVTLLLAAFLFERLVLRESTPQLEATP